MSEEELVRQVVSEFCEKEIEGSWLKIEREGLDRQLISKLSQTGFLGAIVPPELGGAGMSEKQYMVVLEVLAEHSPSVSFYVFLQNSLVASPLMSSSGNEELLKEIASGEIRGTMIHDGFRMAKKNSISINGGLKGDAKLVPLPDAEVKLVSLNGLYLVRGGTVKRTYRVLGFKGIAFGDIEFNGEKAVMISDEKAESVFLKASGPVAAMAIGMARRSINMAIEYSKQREAFGKKLFEFQPISFYLLSLKEQLEAYESYVYGAADKLRAKALALDLARRAARVSLQVHGGYGYLEDSGVERFYRDSMALSLISGLRLNEMIEASRGILGPGSATV